MFWLKTIIASVICFVAVEFRIKAWMKEHGYSKDDIKKGAVEDKLFFLALLCVPVVNIVLMTVLLVASFSDEIMEETMREVGK